MNQNGDLIPRPHMLGLEFPPGSIGEYDSEYRHGCIRLIFYENQFTSGANATLDKTVKILAIYCKAKSSIEPKLSKKILSTEFRNKTFQKSNPVNDFPTFCLPCVRGMTAMDRGNTVITEANDSNSTLYTNLGKIGRRGIYLYARLIE